MTTPPLRTDRLLMREWRETDRGPYAEMNGDPEVMRHFPSTLTPQQSDEMIDRMAAAWRDHEFGLWAVERCDTRELIGFVGLSSP
ncbi:MAG: GNAT family N-acetyltransferase, partial [Ilumatobacteraceae bacterium]|nr:GNAT family N-acetyltransferase [Ilumatobacteraceae bacterium]